MRLALKASLIGGERRTTETKRPYGRYVPVSGDEKEKVRAGKTIALGVFLPEFACVPSANAARKRSPYGCGSGSSD